MGCMNCKTETEIEQAQENFNAKAFLYGAFNNFFGSVKSFWKFGVDGNKLHSKDIHGIDVPFPVVDERGKNAYPDIFIFLLPQGWRDEVSIQCWKTLWERRGYTVLAPSIEDFSPTNSREAFSKKYRNQIREFQHKHRQEGEKFCILYPGHGSIDKYVLAVSLCSVKLWFGMTNLQDTKFETEEMEEQG